MTAPPADPGSPLGLHRVVANHMPHNHRSARLLKQAGFETEGYSRAYLLMMEVSAARKPSS